VTSGQGQPPDLAIRADVEVPERKLAMAWMLRRNTDKALPASHTIEIVFTTPADSPNGAIANIPGILMKQAEQTSGVPLAGLAVKVTDGFFLIGLSNLEADKERNLQLLKERGWFDIPVVYNNNRRAILAMEKARPASAFYRRLQGVDSDLLQFAAHVVASIMARSSGVTSGMIQPGAGNAGRA
jgi:hypothetical protein